jgi:DNA-binding IclR family transcriptional regulator
LINTEKSEAPALDRGIDVVELLASSENALSFSEIRETLRIPRASLARILNTLHRRGIVDKLGQNGQYRLGMRVMYLGHRAQDKIRLRSVAWPFMQGLADDLKETVELSIQDRNQLVLIEQIEGPEDVRVHSRIGSSYPYLHAVSVGKIYLSHMDPIRRGKIVEKVGLPAVTPWTITDKDRLEKELSSIFKNGYAVEDQELRKGVRRVAAAIYDHKYHVAGCLSVAAPLFRIDIGDFPAIGRTVKRVADKISNALGREEGSGFQQTL